MPVPILIGELLALVLPIVKAATPEAQGMVVDWMKRRREALALQTPELIKEIDDAISRMDLAQLADLAVELHDAALRKQAGQPGA